jgi:ABC-type branched-subunit amino acid transport system permease subunit
MTGYTVTAREQAAGARLQLFGLGLIILCLPFLPILLPCYLLFGYLSLDLGWHPLFAGLAAVAPALIAFALLWVSRIIRTVYFGLVTIIGTYIIYILVLSWTNDPIWSGAAAVLGFIIGTILTVRASGYRRREPESVDGEGHSSTI